jgi:hypothetical protein
VILEVALVKLVNLFPKQIGVEEVGIDLARPCRILGLGKPMNGELTPNLAYTGEAGGEILRVAMQHVLRGWAVEARVDPHCPEQRKGGVFRQHLCRSPLRSIILVVDQSLPPRIVPRRRAESDRRRNPGAQPLEIGEIEGAAPMATHECQGSGTILKTPPAAWRT